MVSPAGFEPTAPRLGIWCSIQLSYGDIRPVYSASQQPSQPVIPPTPHPLAVNAPAVHIAGIQDEQGEFPVAKVIISCAITGGIHTPSMSPYLPITPEQIAAESIAAAEAGAAIIHLHARDPDTGEPTPDPSVFMRFLPTIKQSTDAVVNITTGGGLKMTLEERLAAPLAGKAGDVQPEHGQHELQHLRRRRAGEGMEARLGKALSGRHQGLHLPQYLQGYRRHRRDAGQGPRHAVRVRVLRHRPSVQSGLLPG